ncbi:MAG TPA: DUF4136 domain-containing protein [Bryobacteraceae bacterium]|nr:DUF4136 domain-containing protein [Bryobacteraceae bacterium]
MLLRFDKGVYENQILTIGASLWQDRIMRAVDNELQAKGWQKVESGGDAAVSAFGRTTERDTMETFYDGFPGLQAREER